MCYYPLLIKSGIVLIILKLPIMLTKRAAHKTYVTVAYNKLPLSISLSCVPFPLFLFTFFLQLCFSPILYGDMQENRIQMSDSMQLSLFHSENTSAASTWHIICTDTLTPDANMAIRVKFRCISTIENTGKLEGY